MIKTFVIRRG